VADQRGRRRFLQLLAASPLLPFLRLPDAWLDRGGALRLDAALAAQGGAADLIARAADAVSVLDFEAVARARLPEWHWAWLSTGGDDGATIRANRDGFTRYRLRARRLVDVGGIDTSVRLFDRDWETPIFLCPVAGHRTYDPQGELATARAAAARRHLQMLSTMTTTPVEAVNAARGEPVWFQLYHRSDWEQTRQILRRVEAAGCPALVYSVDLLGGRTLAAFPRVARRPEAECAACHLDGQPLTDLRNRPMLTALAPPASPRPEVGTPTWEYVRRLRDATGMKLLVKGIVTREDAELAVANGVDGVYVSNHGGRAENSLRSTIGSLPEVVTGVAGRVPVLVDSGFRRGTDVFKALALGATAVGVGRPYIWGLASFGQEGVEAVLGILRAELELIMRQTGVVTTGGIGSSHIVETP
jgi:isopentenyl diphosphate isomerase/L-lactate dehydrogenase-like FMN-dependent dehydrogenase